VNMNLSAIIGDLRAELERVNCALEMLEKLQTTAGSKHRSRGRKHMDANERKLVSERMRRYWAQRRARQT